MESSRAFIVVCCFILAVSADGASQEEDSALRWLKERLEQTIHKRLFKASQTEVCSQNPADIVFVLDESTSIWNPDFQQQLKFVNDVIDTFRIGDDYTRIGVMTFSDTTNTNILHLGELVNDEKVMKHKISGIQQRYGNTRTDLALTDMLNIEFRSDRIRKGVPQIGVVITDGGSDIPEYTLQEAERVHQTGMTMFAVGVGSSVEEEELQAIATSPDYVFRADNYAVLDKLKHILAWEACKITTKPPATTTTLATTTTTTTTTTTRRPSNIDGCDGHKPLDVLFAVPDESGVRDTDLSLSFVNSVIDTLNIGPTQAMVGLTPRRCLDLPPISLSQFDVKPPLMAAVRSRALTSTAVSAQLEEMMAGFAEENDGRPESKRFGILILDNKSEDAEYAEQAAEQLKREGVTLITVGVGEYVDGREVKRLASSKKHSFMIPSYDDLDQSLTEMIKDLLCQGIV